MEVDDSAEHNWRKEAAFLQKKLAKTEALLRQATEANERLALTFDLIKDGACVCDGKGRLLYMNEAGYSLLGVTSRDAREGQPFFPNYPTWAREILITQALPMAAKVGSWEGSLALCHVGGSEIPITQRIKAHQTSRGDLFFCSILSTAASSTRSEEEVEVSYQELIKHLPVAMSVWRREKTNASLRSSGVEQISNMHKEKPERLSDECSSPFCLVGMNELASRLLGTQMRAGEPLGSTIATNDAGERQDIESFFSETLRSGVASSVSRVHIIQPGAKSKDGADLRTRELSIDAFPLAAGCLGVSFKASHAEEIINDKVQAHPLSGAMASSSFAFCLAVRRENRETGNRGFVKREHITSSSGIGWVFDYVSAGLSNALGCRTEELMGREVCSLCFQDGSDDSMQTLSAAMADGRECAVAVMLSRSTTSPTVRCRLWVSPLEGGQRYLLFYSQLRGVDSPGSASHILSFTEDEDVF